MSKKKSTIFLCFSPPVMIATFVIEIGLLIWALWRYRFSRVVQLAAGILFFLAVFQLAEFNVCTDSWGLDSLTWAKIGYLAITTLPPLGVHLVSVIAGRPMGWVVTMSYIAMVLFMVYFLWVTNSVVSAACQGNYAIFIMNEKTSLLYGLYYYGLEIAGAVIALRAATRVRKKSTIEALVAMVVGYSLLIGLTATVNMLDSSTLYGVPSIMCGFAVLLALIIALYVLPRTARTK